MWASYHNEGCIIIKLHRASHILPTIALYYGAGSVARPRKGLLVHPFSPPSEGLPWAIRERQPVERVFQLHSQYCDGQPSPWPGNPPFPRRLFPGSLCGIPVDSCRPSRKGGGPGRLAQGQIEGPHRSGPLLKPPRALPAANTRYEVKIVTSRELAPLPPHVDSIVMELHEDIGVPRAVNSCHWCESKLPHWRERSFQCRKRPTGTAVVELEDQDDPRHPTILTLFPVVAPNNDSPPRPMPPCATVTVTFQRNAGLSNPTEGGAFSWKVGVANDDNLVDANTRR